MKQRLAQVAEVALGRQRAPQYEQGANLVPYLRSANVVDGALDLSDVKEMNFSPAEQKIYSLQDGDVLVTEGSGSRETVGTSVVWRGEISGTVCFQNTLLRLRPRPGRSDGRYLGWWMRHAHAAGMVAKETRGANIQHLGAESLRGMEGDFPDLDIQCRIADFLDDQVPRIDEAVRLRREQTEALKERLRLAVEDAFDPLGSEMVKASLVLRVTPGYAFPSSGFAPDGCGIRLVRGVNVGVGRLRWDDSVCWPEVTAHLRPWVLRAGDVVLGMDRPWIGEGLRIARVSESDLPALLLQRVALLRARDGLDTDYMFWAYQATDFRSAVEAELTGLSVPHLSGDQIAGHRLPLRPVDDQRQIARRLDELAAQVDAAVVEMSAQIDLLQERKRSLITAAVTGEFDVTTASGRGV